MSEWAIEVGTKPTFIDVEGARLSEDVADLGVARGVPAHISRMYWLSASLPKSDVELLATRLLTDSVLQDYALDELLCPAFHGEWTWVAEVRLKMGVTDAVGESVIKGARDLGVTGMDHAATGTRVYLGGGLDEASARRICERLLVNDVIQTYELRRVNSLV